MSLISYGAIRTVILPGTDIVLGLTRFPATKNMINIYGRGNRQVCQQNKNGKFVLNGTKYSVAVNNGTNPSSRRRDWV